MTTIIIIIYHEGDHYLAVIAGGWWMAWGKTAQAARAAVLKRYRDETERHS